MTQGRYMLGAGNAVIPRKSLVVGYGSRGYGRTYDRVASCPTFPQTCGVAFSPLSNVRNDFHELQGGLLWLPDFTDKVRGHRAWGMRIKGRAAVR